MDARCPRCGATVDSGGRECPACERRSREGWAERYALARAREEESLRALADRSRSELTGEIAERTQRHTASRITRRVWAVIVLLLLVASAAMAFHDRIAALFSLEPSAVAD